MIQAIVFLPLIGAILAGVISVVGAHARNPSGDEVEHRAESHAHGAVPVSEDATVIHASSHEPDAHEAETTPTPMTTTDMTTTTSPSRRRQARARPN